MKTKTLLAFLAVLVMATSVWASVEAGASYRIHQDKTPIADDLHFTVYQKESWAWIESFKIDVDMPPPAYFEGVSFRGWDKNQGDKRLHAVDFSGYGSIPYCTWITINVKFTLNRWNTVRMMDVIWTKLIEPGLEDTLDSGVPDHGFEVTDIDAQGNAQYKFCNDGTQPVVVRNFKYALNQPQWMDPGQLFEWPGWTQAIDSFTVLPEVPYVVDLVNLKPGKYFFAKYDLCLVGNPQPVVNGTNVHQVDPNSSPLGMEERKAPDPDKLLTVSYGADGAAEIRYHLPKGTHVSLAVYSVTGERVASLVDETRSAGEHTVRWDTSDVPSGVYICRLSADGICAAEKMIRLK